MNEQQMKKWIDNASYEQLLSKWRFAPAGDPFFQDEIGNYYSEVMRKKKEECGPDAAVKASKKLGWE